MRSGLRIRCGITASILLFVPSPRHGLISLVPWDSTASVADLETAAVNSPRILSDEALGASPGAMPRGGDPSNLQADVLDVTAALAVIPNDNLDWDEWNRIGMAAWLASSGRAFTAFDAWSQKSGKYDPEATRARWEHYATSPPDRIGAGTLFQMAQAT